MPQAANETGTARPNSMLVQRLRAVPRGGQLMLMAAGAALFALYAVTTSDAVLLEDDGLFLMSSASLGVSHPPGYPVHTLLGWLSTFVPVGTVAYRVHLLSGALGALACVTAGWLVTRRTGSGFAGAVSAVALGASEHFWSQAIVAEVYTLNALICLGAYALSIEAAEQPAGPAAPRTAAAFGLGLATHWPLLVLASPLILPQVLSRFREWLRRAGVLIGLIGAGAIVPYGWMVWRSNQDPAISFYGPLRTWRDVVFYVSRRGYSAVEASATATSSDSWQFALYAARELATTLTPVGAALAAVGIWIQWRRGWRGALLGEVAAVLASTVLLAFLLRFDYDYLKVAVFRPYPLVAYAVVAVWLGTGVAWLIEYAATRGRAIAVVCMAAAVLLPVFLVARNLPLNDRARDRFAEEHARLLLDLVEPNGVLFVYGDTDTGPVGYLHEVVGVRPDVSLFNLQGLVFRNRLMPALSSPATRQQRIDAFLNATTRPVFHMTENVVPPRAGDVHLGFLRRVGGGGQPGVPRPEFREASDVFFRRLAGMTTPTDRWIRVTRNQLLHQYGEFLGLARVSGDETLRRRVEASLSLARTNYFASTGMVESLVQYGTARAHWEEASALLQASEQRRDETLDAERLGREAYLRGFVAFRLGHLDEAIREFRRSIDIDSRPENGAHLALQQLAQRSRSPVGPRTPASERR